MLSAAREVFAAGATNTARSGDSSLFLSMEDAAMRWFLLPSDCETTKLPAATPPFQPRLYPRPEATSGEAITTVGGGDGSDREHHESCSAKNAETTAGRDKVQFHSPPKSIFRPAVEV